MSLPKAVSLSNLIIQKKSFKKNKTKEQFAVKGFAPDMFLKNRVNFLQSSNREVASLGLFNIISRTNPPLICHVCLEEDLENISLNYMAHYGLERLRDLKNKNYEVKAEQLEKKMPNVSFIPIKANTGVIELKEIIKDTLKQYDVSLLFVEGIDKIFPAHNRNENLVSLFESFDQGVEGSFTMVASIRSGFNNENFNIIDVDKNEENLEYNRKDLFIDFFVEKDNLNFYPTQAGYWASKSRMEILMSDNLSLVDKIIMPNVSNKKESDNVEVESKIKKIDSHLTMYSWRFIINNKIFNKEGTKTTRWNHWVVAPNYFDKADYFKLMTKVGPEESVALILENEIEANKTHKNITDDRIKITHLDNYKQAALEELDFNKRQLIEIPSPALPGFNRNTGCTSFNQEKQHGLSVALPPYWYESSRTKISVDSHPQQTVNQFVRRYFKVNPNTHLYTAATSVESNYSFASGVKVTYSAYNFDTTRRVVEYLFEEYLKRADKYDAKVDADKILYLSEAEEILSKLDFNDEGDYSVGLKLKKIIREAKFYGIYVIAASTKIKESKNSVAASEKLFEFIRI